MNFVKVRSRVNIEKLQKQIWIGKPSFIWNCKIWVYSHAMNIEVFIVMLFSVLWKSLYLKDEFKHWSLHRVKVYWSERWNVKPCFLRWKSRGGVDALEVGATILKSGKQSNFSALKIAKYDIWTFSPRNQPYACTTFI